MLVHRAVRVATALIIALSLAVFVGYALHIKALITVLPGLEGMSPLAALGILAMAMSMLADSQGRLGIARALAWGVLVLGGCVLVLHALRGNDTLSPLIAEGLFHFDRASAGRTSIASAAALVLLASAGLNRHRPMLADGLAAVAMVISGLAAIGYAYGVRDLYAVPVFRTMSLHTAWAILALSAVSMVVRPDVGWAKLLTSRGEAGAATRRHLAFVLLPPMAGGALLYAIYAHRLGPAAAMAFLVVLTIVPLALLVLRDGRALQALEAEQAARAELLGEHALDLEQRLGEQAAALAAENSERIKAETAMLRTQRIDAVGQLTGGIAHDFNNLLMAIAGNLELLVDKLPEGHPARRYADNAADATDHGVKLTSQLLAFSRTQKLDIRPVELDPTLLKARDLIGSALGPAIEISMRLNAKDGWAASDPDQLELAVLNLAINARDAMPNGGTLVLESAPCLHRLSSEADEAPYLAVRVIDSGEGMTADVAAQAIEPFYTTKDRGKGTGLGLAQVYGFVRQCGGDLRITSAPGLGTTIELLFPSVAGLTASAHGGRLAKTKASPRGRGQTVLVIDDDDSVRAILVDMLLAAGFQVEQASDGETGLGHLDRITPAAAIIDFVMPGMNGAEVARRAKARLPDLPIIFVSGYHDTLALDGISGATVLRKPFDLEDLRRAISSVLH